MVNKSYLNDAFQDKLDTALADFAFKWGFKQNSPAIEDIRKSGQKILEQATTQLAKIDNDEPNSKDAQKFFHKLMEKDYTPHMGNHFMANSDERTSARKLLKSLAYFIGGNVYTAYPHIFDKNGLAPSGLESRADALSSTDWFQDTTPNIHPDTLKPEIAETTRNPKFAEKTTETSEKTNVRNSVLNGYEQPVVVDESIDLNKEVDYFADLVKNTSSTSELQEVITNSLKPRYFKAIQELEKRRTEFPDMKDADIINGPLIDFATSLRTLISQGLRQIYVEPSKTSKVKAPEALPKAPLSFDERLAKLEAEIDAGLAKTNDVTKLVEFHENSLLPKAAALKDTVKALKESGADENLIHQKERHLQLIKASMHKTLCKMNTLKLDAETLAMLSQANKYPTLEEVITPIAEEPVSFKFVDASTAVADLPALPAETLAFKSSPEEFKAPEDPKPFEFVNTSTFVSGLPDLFSKLDNTAKGRDPANHSQNSRKILGLVDVQDVDHTTIVADDAFEAVDTRNKTSRESPKLVFKLPAANENIFKRHWRKAIGFGAALTVTFAAAASMLLSGGNPLDAKHEKKAATPEPTTQTVKQEVVQQPNIDVAAPNVENPVDVASVAPEIVVAPVAKIANTAVAPVAKIVKTAIAAKAKVDFSPAASGNVTYEPIVIKEFDPLNMKSDIASLLKACKQAGVTGPNTVCGSILPANTPT